MNKEQKALAQPVVKDYLTTQPVQAGVQGGRIWMATADGRKPFVQIFSSKTGLPITEQKITATFWASDGSGGPVTERVIKMTRSEQTKPPTT